MTARHFSRSFVALLAVGLWYAATVTLGSAGEPARNPADSAAAKQAAAKFDTPQAAFDAAQAAAAKSDWRAFCRTLTPESRDALAGGLAATQAALIDYLEQGLLGESDPQAKVAAAKQIAGLVATLDRHGLDREKIKAQLAAPSHTGKGRPQQPDVAIPRDRRTLEQLAQSIKDRDAFITQSLDGIKKLGFQAGFPPQLGKEARLHDVAVVGEVANARVLIKTSLGSEEGLPLKLHRIDGGWRIELPMLIE